MDDPERSHGADCVFVSNAIPCFKDPVTLIGAPTSIPLTLLLPAIRAFSILRPARSGNISFILMAFSSFFTWRLWRVC